MLYNERIDLSKLVGDFLRSELRSRHISQLQFADMVGVDERTVRRWVKGDLNRLDIVSDIAQALGLEVWDILHK